MHIIRFAVIFAIRPAASCRSALSTITCVPLSYPVAMSNNDNTMGTYVGKRVYRRMIAERYTYQQIKDWAYYTVIIYRPTCVVSGL